MVWVLVIRVIFNWLDFQRKIDIHKVDIRLLGESERTRRINVTKRYEGLDFAPRQRQCYCDWCQGWVDTEQNLNPSIKGDVKIHSQSHRTIS